MTTIKLQTVKLNRSLWSLDMASKAGRRRSWSKSFLGRATRSLNKRKTSYLTLCSNLTWNQVSSIRQLYTRKGWFKKIHSKRLRYLNTRQCSTGQTPWETGTMEHGRQTFCWASLTCTQNSRFKSLMTYISLKWQELQETQKVLTRLEQKTILFS